MGFLRCNLDIERFLLTGSANFYLMKDRDFLVIFGQWEKVFSRIDHGYGWVNYGIESCAKLGTSLPFSAYLFTISGNKLFSGNAMREPRPRFAYLVVRQSNVIPIFY